MVEGILGDAGIAVGSVDAFAVAAGPGSFTGIRIGMGLAKGMALALGKPVVSVPTLEALAYGLEGMLGGTGRSGEGDAIFVCPTLDARNGHAYAALYRADARPGRTGGGRAGGAGCRYAQAFGACALPVAELAERVAFEVGAMGVRSEVWLTGDGVRLFPDALSGSVPGLRLAPEALAYCSAASVGLVGHMMAMEGLARGCHEAAITYVRASQAEQARRAGAAEREA